MNLWKEFFRRNQTKTLLGIETDTKLLRTLRHKRRNQTKTLLGIETKWRMAWLTLGTLPQSN